MRPLHLLCIAVALLLQSCCAVTEELGRPITQLPSGVREVYAIAVAPVLVPAAYGCGYELDRHNRPAR